MAAWDVGVWWMRTSPLPLPVGFCQSHAHRGRNLGSNPGSVAHQLCDEGIILASLSVRLTVIQLSMAGSWRLDLGDRAPGFNCNTATYWPCDLSPVT